MLFGISPTLLPLKYPYTPQSTISKTAHLTQLLNLPMREPQIQREEVIHWRRVGRFLQGHVIKASRDRPRNLKMKGVVKVVMKELDPEMTLRSVMVWIVQSLIPGCWRPHRFSMYLSCSLSTPLEFKAYWG